MSISNVLTDSGKFLFYGFATQTMIVLHTSCSKLGEPVSQISNPATKLDHTRLPARMVNVPFNVMNRADSMIY